MVLKGAGMPKHGEGGEDWRDPGFWGAESRRLRTRHCCQRGPSKVTPPPHPQLPEGKPKPETEKQKAGGWGGWGCGLGWRTSVLLVLLDSPPPGGGSPSPQWECSSPLGGLKLGMGEAWF